MAEFNEVIHQSTRLKIMSALMALEPGAMIDFSSLAKLLKLTDGNIGAHILKLEEAGYIKVSKSFVERKPRTHLSLTTRGRHKFEEHVEALKTVLNGQK
jgi:DNA-binding MarR family transcriptional regulator